MSVSQSPKVDTVRFGTEFRQNGFAAIIPAFDAEFMADINAHFDHFVTQSVPRMKREEVYYESAGDKSTLKQLNNMHLYDDYFRHLLESSVLRDLAAAALEEEVVPKNVEYFNKPAGIGQPTPPHQDGYYFHLTPCKAVTAWLALEPVDDANGCIHYVRGSHKAEGFRPHGRSQILGFSQGITDFGTEDDKRNTVAHPGPAGTLLMHDARTIHWAGPNNSPTRSRRALGFIYFGESARIDEEAKAAYKQKLERDLLDAKRI